MADRIIGPTAHDQPFMKKALAQAVLAAQADEVPIGAVVVSPEGNILGLGYNQTEKAHSQSRHAEVLAIEMAGQALADWRLVGCTLYVTVQPCLMCLGLIGLSRINRIVYGTVSPLFGYDLVKEDLPEVYQKHLKGITSGVLEGEAQEIIEEFFKKRRMKSEEYRRNKDEAA